MEQMEGSLLFRRLRQLLENKIDREMKISASYSPSPSSLAHMNSKHDHVLAHNSRPYVRLPGSINDQHNEDIDFGRSDEVQAVFEMLGLRVAFCGRAAGRIGCQVR